MGRSFWRLPGGVGETAVEDGAGVPAYLFVGVVEHPLEHLSAAHAPSAPSPVTSLGAVRLRSRSSRSMAAHESVDSRRGLPEIIGRDGSHSLRQRGVRKVVVEDVAGMPPYVLVGVVEHPLERGSVSELLELVELIHGGEADGRVRIV